MIRPILLAVVVLAGCTPQPNLPVGPQAYAAFPPPNAEQLPSDYKIGALDKISITVFQEPELSLDEVPVDASGNILLPLIGAVTAAGKTTGQLSKEVADRLGERYLVDPQVSVIVASSVSQKVTVEGSVMKPGVYDLRGQTTLLQALAMAEGPNKVAALNHVAVFRTIDGQRMGALFDIRDIRRGEAPDPEILGNDVVVVGLSNIKSAWQDVVDVLPALAIFRPLGY